MDIALGISAITLLIIWLVPCTHMWVAHKLERPPEWLNSFCLAWLIIATPWFFYRPLQVLVLILLSMVICLL